MRPALLAPLALLALAPAANACTLDNCVEVRTASATWAGTDLHSLDARCTVVGRGGTRFVVVAEATARDAFLPVVPSTVDVRCTVRQGSTVVYDAGSAATLSPVVVHADTFTSGPNVSVCVTASATWDHTSSHDVVGVSDC